MAEQVLDNALIAAGLLDDPQKMIARIYKLLESV
jgi:molecular chaperone HtpG